MRLTTLFALTLAVVLSPPLLSQTIRPGGPVDGGTRAVCDLPKEQHMRNTGGSDGPGGPGTGSGLCVPTSCEVAANRWQSSPLDGFQAWCQKRPGGSYPEKLEQSIVQFCREKGRQIPRYVQHTGGDETVLDLAMKTGRMVGVTYAGQDDFYRGETIAHMVDLAHLDPPSTTNPKAAIVDNNRPGQWVWMTRKQFLDRWRGVDDNGRPLLVRAGARWMQVGGGWCVIFLDSPPPPYSAKPSDLALTSIEHDRLAKLMRTGDPNPEKGPRMSLLTQLDGDTATIVGPGGKGVVSRKELESWIEPPVVFGQCPGGVCPTPQGYAPQVYTPTLFQPAVQAVPAKFPDEYGRAFRYVGEDRQAVLVIGKPPAWFKEEEQRAKVFHSPSFAGAGDGVYACWKEDGDEKWKPLPPFTVFGDATKVGAKIDPKPELPKGEAKPEPEDEPKNNFGVDLGKLTPGKWFHNGAEVSKGEVMAAVAGDALADDSERWFLVFVGSPTDQAKFSAAVKSLDQAIADKLHVKAYSPTDWQVSQFALPVGVSVRKPAKGRVGEEAGRLAGEVSTDTIKRLVGDSMNPPKPMPAPSPTPTPDQPSEPQPQPAPGPATPNTLFGLPMWALAVIAAGLTYFFTRRKS